MPHAAWGHTIDHWFSDCCMGWPLASSPTRTWSLSDSHPKLDTVVAEDAKLSSEPARSAHRRLLCAEGRSGCQGQSSCLYSFERRGHGVPKFQAYEARRPEPSSKQCTKACAMARQGNFSARAVRLRRTDGGCKCALPSEGES